MIFFLKHLIIIFLFLIPASKVYSGLPDTIDEIRMSVVSIGIVRPPKSANPKGPQHEYRGTGFIVGNGNQVITNYHVIPENLENETNAKLAIFIGKGKSVNAWIADISKTDQEHDLALLSFRGPKQPALVFDSASKVREGQEIAFTGFPIGMVIGMYPVTSKGIISAITPTVIPASSSKSLTPLQIKRMRNAFNVYQLDAIAYPGNSGSPVYNPNTGGVIGIINSVFVKSTKEAVLENPSAITYAIPASYAKDLLEE